MTGYDNRCQLMPMIDTDDVTITPPGLRGRDNQALGVIDCETASEAGLVDVGAQALPVTIGHG